MITQVSVAPSVRYFEEGLTTRWGLTKLEDTEKPCLFFGVREQQTLIENHKGFKLLYFVDKNDKWQNFNNVNNLACVYSPYANIPKEIPSKSGWFETRVNTVLQPVPLGRHVFVYLRHPTDRAQMGAKFVNVLKSKIKHPVLELCPTEILPFESVVAEYYSKAFVAVNFTESSGITSVCDLGLMGVQTFMNTQHNLRSVIPFQHIYHLVEMINKKAQNVRKIQQPINNYTLNDYWQDPKFWLS